MKFFALVALLGASVISSKIVLSSDDLEISEEELVMIDSAVKKAQIQVENSQLEEVNLLKRTGHAPRGTPSYGKPSRASLAMAKTSTLLEMSTYKINGMMNKRPKRSKTSSHMSKMINSKSVNRKVIEKIKYKVQEYFQHSSPNSCSPLQDNAPCDHTARYRTYDGRCNNLQSPSNGQSTSLLRRLLPAEYEDGISQPRTRGHDGNFLPNPRVVSQRIHTTQPTPDPQFSLTMMQWGQFIDHDLALSPVHRGFNNSILNCKECDSARDNPACLPILIQSDDSFYPAQGRKCMPFTRSLPGQQKLGPREHINQITHYHDASMIYGSDSCVARDLRVPDSYLLRMSANPASHPARPMKDLLPMTANNHECRSTDGMCFLAGDERVNEQPGLTTFHTLLVREHNDIGKELAVINPHWSNEKVFQETRRIVSAIIQHITYNEFLPRVLGPGSIKRFSLKLLTSGYYRDYNSKCSAAIFTEFSTAAFRFGHSMIKPNLTMMSEEEMIQGGGEQIPLREVFHNPDMVRTGNVIDGLVRGLVMSPMELVDNRVSNEVANHLFEKKGKQFSGMDLSALNIQRSRDHGIPGYNKYREICGLNRALRFSDFSSEIPVAWVAELEAVYRHPDDVDLFPGLLAERKLAGAAVGPTLACLIGLQFRHLRSCDRYWYESGDPMVRFTVKQLRQIRGETLSGLLCRNCDQPGSLPQAGMDKMQRLINPMRKCKDIKHIDLEYWKEDKDDRCEMNGFTWDLGSYILRDSEVCTCTSDGPVCERRASVH